MRRGVTALRLLRASLRKRGVRGTVARSWRIVEQRNAVRRKARADAAFDHQRGVETASWVYVPDLDVTSANLEHAVRYEPSSVSEFDLLMGKLEIDHKDFTFVDYGSGKGRVLMLAADYPFRRIVGIEFAESLHSVAQENIASLGPDAARVEALLGDATEFEPPPDPLVLYFFHPFGAPALRQVLAKVLDSLDRHPRPAYIVLTGPPEFAQTVEESGFERVDVDELGWLTRGVFAAPRNDSLAQVVGQTEIR
jgi:cyclopropane fatty-acyl-phospholipid synthase-like methyltransferase